MTNCSTDSMIKTFAGDIISRNRFKALLTNLHVANTVENINSNNCLYKIQSLLNILNERFVNAFRPGKEICIDEQNILF